MKTVPYKILFLVSLIIGFSACEEPEESTLVQYSVNCKGQKGPFTLESMLFLDELDENFEKTGNHFNVQSISLAGEFLLNLRLNSPYVDMLVNGYYFSEMYGCVSPDIIRLNLLADLSESENVNVNILTHLISGRIYDLVAEGVSFQDAREQSKAELLDFLGVTDDIALDFEQMDITSSDQENGLLLAASLMFQRYEESEELRDQSFEDLNTLIDQVYYDFAPDGIVSDTALIDTVLYNISVLNKEDARQNIVNYYRDMGKSVSPPDFEPFLALFENKYSRE